MKKFISLDEWRKKGGAHYKTEGVEPIDLYRSGGMLWDFALGSIIKYAFRSRREILNERKEVLKNLNKIIHYAEILKAEFTDEIETGGNTQSYPDEKVPSL